MVIDYTLLDQPPVLERLFYPRQEWTRPPPGASDHRVVAALGIALSARFYPAGKANPTILLFHGNGEIACDYDWIAPLYHREDINLFVADYRGYGLSTGRPVFSAMAADAHAVFGYLRGYLEAESYRGCLLVMGRSLGTHSAVELAYSCPEALAGIIVESGLADPSRLLGLVGASPSQVAEMSRASRQRLQKIRVPALVIHGECDELIAVDRARALYQDLGSPGKRLLVIPGAGHNDLLMVGLEPYFQALREFVASSQGIGQGHELA